MATDPTEAARMAMLPDMPDELKSRVEAGEEVWTPGEFREAFTVMGFMAPFVVVIRKADNVKGSLMFTHNPRYYFGFQAD